MSDTLAVVLVLTTLLTVWVGSALVVAKYAERHGQSFFGFALLGLFVSPMIALIAAAIIGDRPPARG